jgi:hypothetical protein
VSIRICTRSAGGQPGRRQIHFRVVGEDGVERLVEGGHHHDGVCRLEPLGAVEAADAGHPLPQTGDGRVAPSDEFTAQREEVGAAVRGQSHGRGRRTAHGTQDFDDGVAGHAEKARGVGIA